MRWHGASSPHCWPQGCSSKRKSRPMSLPPNSCRLIANSGMPLLSTPASPCLPSLHATYEVPPERHRRGQLPLSRRHVQAHPAIIVSNDQLQEDEDGMFYLVLITSNDWLNPQYSYPLSDEMVDGFTFSKPSLVKCQIITGNIERDVQRRLGSIKQKYFDEIVDKIVESIF